MCFCVTYGLSTPPLNLRSSVINYQESVDSAAQKIYQTLFSAPTNKSRKSDLAMQDYFLSCILICSCCLFSLIPGLKRFLIGLIYVSCYGALGSIFKSKYLISDEYAVSVHRVRCGNATYLLYVQNLPSVYQLLYLIIWGRIYLWMYVSIWILVVSKILFFSVYFICSFC